MADGSFRLPSKRAEMERVSQSESFDACRRRGKASGVERMREASMASRRTVGSASFRALRRMPRGEG